MDYEHWTEIYIDRIQSNTSVFPLQSVMEEKQTLKKLQALKKKWKENSLGIDEKFNFCSSIYIQTNIICFSKLSIN